MSTSKSVCNSASYEFGYGLETGTASYMLYPSNRVRTANPVVFYSMLKVAIENKFKMAAAANLIYVFGP